MGLADERGARQPPLRSAITPGLHLEHRCHNIPFHHTSRVVRVKRRDFCEGRVGSGRRPPDRFSINRRFRAWPLGRCH
jgi:hypothetical protein